MGDTDMSGEECDPVTVKRKWDRVGITCWLSSNKCVFLNRLILLMPVDNIPLMLYLAISHHKSSYCYSSGHMLSLEHRQNIISFFFQKYHKTPVQLRPQQLRWQCKRKAKNDVVHQACKSMQPHVNMARICLLDDICYLISGWSFTLD